MELRKRLLASTFLILIGMVPLAQIAIELATGRRPLAAEFVLQMPTEEHLREVEAELEETSWFARKSRPLAQYVWFQLSGQPGGKTLVGLDGWLFYLPTVRFLVESFPPPDYLQPDFKDPSAAVTDFHRQLASRGIRLLVVPVPGKASIYPDRLSSRADPEHIVDSSHTRRFISQLTKAGIETVDLFEAFRQARQQHLLPEGEEYYLRQDTHWAPEGASLAARVVAQRILAQGWVTRGSTEYTHKEVTISRRSDILRMGRLALVESRFPPQEVNCHQVFESGTGRLYHDEPSSPVLVLGDSFLRIYQSDEPKAAGFLAHLALNLQRPVASIVNDGGASTLVRQQLSRRADLLEGKKLVVWEFVERDLRFGTEGWKQVPIP